MSTPASIAKHPIHPMLVALPIGLWVFALVADIVHAATGSVLWNQMAFYLVAGGIGGALLAALPGFVDFFLWMKGSAKKVALFHMGVNLAAVGVSGISLWQRIRMAPGDKLPLILSVIVVGLITLGGWLGGELVYRYGIAVDLNDKGQVQKGADWLG